jgi:hypothetical protein
LTAVTFWPDWVQVAFQPWDTVWPECGKVKVRFQPLSGSPRLTTVTEAPKPPAHWFDTV